MKLPLIGICIINYHQPQLTLNCLNSLANQTYQNFKVFLVDNESKNEFSDKQLAKYPFINYHKEKLNTGFATANNTAVKQALKAGCDYIIILNNDTEVNPNFLKNFNTYSATQLASDILGCNIVYLANPNKLWFAGGIVYQPFLLTSHFLINQSISKTRPLPNIRTTGWLTGCTMGMKADFFKTVGFFDESFFAYLEDLDLCLRAKKMGGRCLIINQALVKHAVSPTIGVTGSNYFTQLKLKLQAANSAKIIKKYYPRYSMLLIPLNIVTQIFVYLLQKRLKLTQIPSFISSAF